MGNQMEMLDNLQDGTIVWKDYQDQACGMMIIVLVRRNSIVKLKVSLHLKLIDHIRSYQSELK